MTTRIAKVAFKSSNILGETPVWSGSEQALYWVDIRAPALHRFKPNGGDSQIWPMPDLCSAVVPAAAGGFILAFRREIAHFDPKTAKLTSLAEIEPEEIDNRLNEAKCDRAGRLWIGSMRDFGAEIEGALYRVGPDLKPEKILSDIRIPNSLGWSPDSKTMYFADTGKLVLQRYCYDVATGTLGKGFPLIGETIPGRPDGCAVDSQGHIWNARYGAGRVICVSPDGKIVDTVSVDGALQVTSCALGGPDLKTLYITTAKQKLDEKALGQQPNAGHLFAIDVETPGMEEPGFQFDQDARID